MKKTSLFIVAVVLVLVGVHFLTPTKPHANEKPIIKYIASATQAPVDHVTSVCQKTSQLSESKW